MIGAMRHITSVHHDPIQVRQNWLCHLRCDKITSVHHDPTQVRQKKRLHHVTMTQLRWDKKIRCHVTMTKLRWDKKDYIISPWPKSVVTKYVSSPWPNSGVTRYITSGHHNPTWMWQDITLAHHNPTWVWQDIYMSAHHDPTWVWQDRLHQLTMKQLRCEKTLRQLAMTQLWVWQDTASARHDPTLGVTRHILGYLSTNLQQDRLHQFTMAQLGCDKTLYQLTMTQFGCDKTLHQLAMTQLGCNKKDTWVSIYHTR